MGWTAARIAGARRSAAGAIGGAAARMTGARRSGEGAGAGAAARRSGEGTGTTYGIAGGPPTATRGGTPHSVSSRPCALLIFAVAAEKARRQSDRQPAMCSVCRPTHIACLTSAAPTGQQAETLVSNEGLVAGTKGSLLGATVRLVRRNIAARSCVPPAFWAPLVSLRAPAAWLLCCIMLRRAGPSHRRPHRHKAASCAGTRGKAQRLSAAPTWAPPAGLLAVVAGQHPGRVALAQSRLLGAGEPGVRRGVGAGGRAWIGSAGGGAVQWAGRRNSQGVGTAGATGEACCCCGTLQSLEAPGHAFIPMEAPQPHQPGTHLAAGSTSQTLDRPRGRLCSPGQPLLQ